jgi:hypothetical protein
MHAIEVQWRHDSNSSILALFKNAISTFVFHIRLIAEAFVRYANIL